MALITGPPVTLPPSQVPADRIRGHGLQSQASVTTEADNAPPGQRIAHRGVQHEVNACGRAACWSHDCDHTDDKFGDQRGQDWITTTPFTVYATGPRCSGADAIANAQRRATEYFAATEWTAVEYAVQTGACGARPYLAGEPDGIDLRIRPGSGDGYTALAAWRVADTSFAPVTPVGTDPVSPEVALAALEWGMRDYAGPGVIHAPAWSYPWWRPWLRDAGPRLVTQLGAGWALGRGYVSVAPGTDPDEMPSLDDIPDFASVWLYATGAVRIWRSAVDMTPQYAAYDYRDNRSMMLVERAYTVSIQCPYIAVNVQLGQ